MTLRLTLFAALALAFLPACGGEGAAPSSDAPAAPETTAPAEASSSASGAHPVPCSWLSSEAATSTLGADVTVTSPDGYPATCHVESSPFTWAGTVVVLEGDDLATMASLRDLTPENTLDAAALVRGVTLDSVEELGERAGWVRTPEEYVGSGEVLVEQGGRVFAVSLRSSAGPDFREKTEALARAIVAQI